MYVLGLKTRMDTLLRGDDLISSEAHEMLAKCFEVDVSLTLSVCKSDT